MDIIHMFSDFIFTIFGDWHMAAGAFLMTFIYAYKAKTGVIIFRHSRGYAVRALNWALFALIFLIMAVFGHRIGVYEQRALLRSGFGFLLLSEIAYNLPIILLMLKDLLAKGAPDDSVGE